MTIIKDVNKWCVTQESTDTNTKVQKVGPGSVGKGGTRPRRTVSRKDESVRERGHQGREETPGSRVDVGVVCQDVSGSPSLTSHG